MPSIADFSPLQYRPTDTHMGRWHWQHLPAAHTELVLYDQMLQPIASVRDKDNGQWTSGLEDVVNDWLTRVSEKQAEEARVLLAARTERTHAGDCSARRAAADDRIVLGFGRDAAGVARRRIKFYPAGDHR